MAEPKSSKSKRIVLTGCTRGLGRALAEFFIAQGHAVAGCGRSAAEIRALSTKYGPPHDFQVADVSVDAEMRRWAGRIVAEWGVPDFVINNAAVIAPNAPLWEVSAEEFGRVLDINVKGVASVIRHFAPALIANGRGVMVNFSSGWGKSTAPAVAPYCASKWAIEGLTQALAQELPAGVAAIALNPGIIDTEMLRSCLGGEASRYLGAAQWAQRAGPFILCLTARQNGWSLDIPGVPGS